MRDCDLGAQLLTMFAKLRDFWTSSSERKNDFVQPPVNTLPATPLAQATRTPYVAGNFSVDEYRPMKIVVIGAGQSGLVAAIRYILAAKTAIH